VIFRLLAIAIWLTASFSAHAEGVWAHALAEVSPSALAQCAASADGDPATHCASACLATSGVSVRTAATLTSPQPSDPTPHAALVAVIIAFEPSLLPPSRAGPWAEPRQAAHLRDLAGIRLLI